MLPFAMRLRQARSRQHLSQEALAEALGVSPRSIARWEQGHAVPQASIRLQLSRFFGLPPEELFGEDNRQAPLIPLWSVPYSRNPFFTGREEFLSRLHELLSQKHMIALTQSWAISGLGGMGKTQIALEYAHRYAREYHAVFWLATETAESLMTSLQQTAEQMQIAECQAPEQARMVRAVQRWLETHTDWLLIGDNVEDLDLLQAVLPSKNTGTLLLTTRRQALGSLAERLELPPMSIEEGTVLLLRRTKQFTMPSQDAPFSQELPQTSCALPEATELVKLLEGLPLALDQAGAYIEETGCSIENYLQRYHSQRKLLLARRGIHNGAHPASVVTTLKLAVEQIEQEQPAAAEFMRLCAFLHPDAIPEELFAYGAAHLGSVLGPVVADPYQFDLLLVALRNASLVTRSPTTRTLSIHRLVQAVLRDQMEPTTAHLWCERALHVVNAAFPEPDLVAWPRCERFLAQAIACVSLLESIEKGLPTAGELFFKAGNYLTERGRNREAEPLLDLAVAQGEQVYGSDHCALIPWLEKQAELCWYQGKNEQAEQLLYRILAIEQQHLGVDHPRFTSTLSNLATVLRDQEKYEQAESLFQQALCIQKQHWGPEHPEVAEILDNLAILYWNQGKNEQAELFYQQALSIQEVQLGSDHQRTAVTINNLATLYRTQGRYKQAEAEYQRALRIRQQQLGPDHPGTASTLQGLATLYRQQGKYEQAEQLYKQVLSIRVQRLGPDHPNVALALSSLALLYTEQRKYKQARSLCQQALSIQEQIRGSQHTATAEVLHQFATICEAQGNAEEAASLYQRALAIREQFYGPQHARTIETRERLDASRHA